jgi:hypothetical protein
MTHPSSIPICVIFIGKIQLQFVSFRKRDSSTFFLPHRGTLPFLNTFIFLLFYLSPSAINYSVSSTVLYHILSNTSLSICKCFQEWICLLNFRQNMPLTLIRYNLNKSTFSLNCLSFGYLNPINVISIFPATQTRNLGNN